MGLKRILVANRGEIAIRIIRAANDLGLESVGVFSEDDSASLHTKMTDETCPLGGRGVPAYLDVDGIIEAARNTGCDAVHPGYGFKTQIVSRTNDPYGYFSTVCHQYTLQTHSTLCLSCS